MIINGTGYVKKEFDVPSSLVIAKDVAVKRFAEFRNSEELLRRMQDAAAIVNGYMTYDNITEDGLEDFKKAVADISDICSKFIASTKEIINMDAFIISGAEQATCNLQAEVNLPADSDSTGKFHPNRTVVVGSDHESGSVLVPLKDLWVLKMISQVFGPIKGANIQSVKSADKIGSEGYV